jgi:Co/Zn/Cd efflux system component
MGMSERGLWKSWHHGDVTHTTEEGVIRLHGPDSRDTANRARAMRAIAVSSFGLLFTSTFELVVVVLSGSVALLADGLHNLGVVFSSALAAAVG